ncbi:MAG: prolyl oligopeptidase family serine peptidase [Gemmatimonadota bacterium]
MMSAKALVAITLAAAAFLACDTDPVAPKDNPVDQNDAPRLTLSVDSIVVNAGDGSLLTATLSNASGTTEYVSRDQSVATVNANGAIRATGAGSTHVLVMLAGRSDVRDSVRVRVLPQPAYADPCPVARPSFSGPATAADRALFAYHVNAPLNLQKTAQTTTTTFTLSSITYDSPAGGPVTGIMAEPVGRSGLRPGMVILHPSGTPAKGLTPQAQMLAQHGAVVIAIDAPYFRRGGTSMFMFMSLDRREQIQLMQDLQRAVDVLIATGKVDPARIAFEGYSYGGSLGSGFVGIEPRLKAAVLVAANGGLVTRATIPGALSNLANQSCATRALWFQVMAPIEPIRFLPHASTTALLFQAGRFDDLVPAADARALYDAASSPNKELRWYETGHVLPEQALTEKHEWLRQQIGIDPRAGT